MDREAEAGAGVIGLACLIGAILSALVLGLAVIVMDLRRDIRAFRTDAASAAGTLLAALPRKRIRRKAVVAS